MGKHTQHYLVAETNTPSIIFTGWGNSHPALVSLGEETHTPQALFSLGRETHPPSITLTGWGNTSTQHYFHWVGKRTHPSLFSLAWGERTHPALFLLDGETHQALFLLGGVTNQPSTIFTGRAKQNTPSIIFTGQAKQTHPGTVFTGWKNKQHLSLILTESFSTLSLRPVRAWHTPGTHTRARSGRGQQLWAARRALTP